MRRGNKGAGRGGGIWKSSSLEDGVSDPRGSGPATRVGSEREEADALSSSAELNKS